MTIMDFKYFNKASRIEYNLKINLKQKIENNK